MRFDKYVVSTMSNINENIIYIIDNWTNHILLQNI